MASARSDGPPRRSDVRSLGRQNGTRPLMNNIFYIIGVVVVVLIILGYFGLR
jgi:hypothetical protein